MLCHNFITLRIFINLYHYLNTFICTIKGGAKIIYFFTVSSFSWENGSVGGNSSKSLRTFAFKK